jgi:hypothetical protein
LVKILHVSPILAFGLRILGAAYSLGTFDIEDCLPEARVETVPAAIAADQVRRPVPRAEERQGSIAEIGLAGL